MPHSRRPPPLPRAPISILLVLFACGVRSGGPGPAGPVQATAGSEAGGESAVTRQAESEEASDSRAADSPISGAEDRAAPEQAPASPAPPPARDRAEVSQSRVQTVSGATAPAGSADGGGSAGPVAPTEPAPVFRRSATAPRFATVSLGGGQTLELQKMRVSVVIEGFRARTIVDHIFHNPHDRAVEGTFHYPLPPEASLSSYAMFLGTRQDRPVTFFGPSDRLRALGPVQIVRTSFQELTAAADPSEWGELRVGRIVAATRAREVYEQVTRRRVDPALVEQVAPNTFDARVFPIRAHGLNRVIVAYDQTLPRVGSGVEYDFPVPTGHLQSFDFDLVADRSAGAAVRSVGDVAGVVDRSNRHDAIHSLHLEGGSRGGRLAFAVDSPAPGGVEVLAGSNPERGEDHVVLRLRADQRFAAGGAARSAPQGVFLLDTSFSEDPDRFGIDVALMRAILERTPELTRFNVVTFDAGARWLRPEGWFTNDAAGRDAALDRLDGVLLEGATDLGAALRALAHPPGTALANGAPLDVFLLTDGAVTWGETDGPTMLSALSGASFAPRFYAYRTGLGAENLELFRELTRQGGIFNCPGRAQIPACAVAHRTGGARLRQVAVVPTGAHPAQLDDVVVAGNAATLAPGTDLLVAARVRTPGTALLRIVADTGGASRTVDMPIEVRPQGVLAPRAWAEIALAKVLATREPELEPYALALSQYYRIPTRLTSLLVLETDAEYEQYDLERAQASLTAGRIADSVARASAARRNAAATAWARLERVLRASADRHHLLGVDGGRIFAALSRTVSRRDPTWLSRSVDIPLVRAGAGTASYLRGRGHDPDGLGVFRDEADRRRNARQLGAAVRALSTIVENDPAGAEAARLVAYRLDAWGADAEAAELLFDVLQRRPYEPQSYRDLANVLGTRRPSITALLFEAALAGTWDARFRGVQTVALEEYGLFMRDVQRLVPSSPLAAFLRERGRALHLDLPNTDLRVTMTWNTDNTDIDLWVTDPSGEKCMYNHRQTASGLSLLDDVTQGFGPERLQAQRTVSGEYVIQAHYYGNNGNRLVAETHVTLTVVTHAGRADEQIRRYNIALQRPGDVATVARVRF